MSRTGYVLVGGESSRMGRDKALLPFRGGPLAASVARVVAAAAGGATLVGSPDRYGKLGFPAIPDLYPGQGPLGGIVTALHHTSADWNLIVACDMPELNPWFLGGLLEAAAHLDPDALVPRGLSGRLEPLCAVYHRRALPVLSAALQAGIRKVAAAFQPLRVAAMPVKELAPFQNVNTPEDWAAYDARK